MYECVFVCVCVCVCVCVYVCVSVYLSEWMCGLTARASVLSRTRRIVIPTHLNEIFPKMGDTKDPNLSNDLYLSQEPEHEGSSKKVPWSQKF